MIEIKNVSFFYQGNEQLNAVENLNLSIPKGQVLVLCGESGCGKTTITRLMNGLIPNFYKGELAGEIQVNGRDITKMPLYEIAESTGSVFQNPRSQFFNVDTNSELSFACENLGYPKDEIVARVNATVKDFKIQRLLGKSLFHLSGGEKQMIACASVCVTAPDIIILDEPSSNLDVRHISILAEIIRKWKAQGKTVIVSEHRLYYLTGVADRFVCLSKGKIAFDLPTDELLKLEAQKLCDFGLRTLDVSRLKPEPVSIEDSHLLYLEDFSFSYKRQKECLRLEKLCVPQNEVIAIIGNNGAAKSTLGRCLCGIEKAGVLHDGEAVLSYKARLKKCYMVMQDVNHQLFTESVMDELLISMKKPDEQEALEILAQLGLSAYAKRHPMSLSGGEKQRVAIATALASDREYIVLDEPTSGLDYKHMKEVALCLKRLKQMGKTVFVITHDVELIYHCCTYVVHIEAGEVINQFAMNKHTHKFLKDYFILK
jgi:energy-coupling factor transport system ATP-binding protein